MIRAEVDKRVNAIFVDRAEAQIKAAIDTAVTESFNTEYQRVSPWGQPEGEVTTIRKQLEKTVSGYWSAAVDPKSGKASTSGYNTVTRAEFLMTQI